MKRKIGLAVLLIIFSLNGFSQAPDWQWAKSGAGDFFDESRSVDTDGNGNVYVTGFFKSSIITFGTTTLYNAISPFARLFITKYDSIGNVLWAKSSGGSSSSESYSVATDGDGNVYMTGFFSGSNITIGTITLNGIGSDNLFLVKYDSNGNVLWAKSAGGSGNQFNACYSAATDGNGNVFVTGLFTSSSITFGTTTLNNAGFADLFIVKYDSSGNVLWAKSAGGIDCDGGYSVATDGEGNVFLSGSSKSSAITFGTSTFNNTGFCNSNIFIVKYDSNGNVLWAKSALSNSNCGNIQDVATDGDGNVYMTGTYGHSSITFGTTTLYNAGMFDLFIVKYDSSGNVLWAKSAGGNSDDYGTGVATDGNGNVYMTGWFVSFSMTFGTTTLSNSGLGDLFIVKYDSSGNLLYTKSPSGESWDASHSIATDKNGHIYITGYFYSTPISFGTINLTNVSSTGSDIFIAKLDTAIVTGHNEIETFENDILVFPNPFSESTEIIFTSSQTGFTTLKLFNALGQEVKKLFAEKVGAGKTYKVILDGKDLQTGIFFCNLTGEGINETRKIVLIKK